VVTLHTQASFAVVIMCARLSSIVSSCLVLQVLQVLGGHHEAQKPTYALERARFKYQFGKCKGVKSGLNLPKVHDGAAPINVVCASWGDGAKCSSGRSGCCVKAGTCVGNKTRIGDYKPYYEGGCSPDSLDSSHEDYDPGCTQIGECHPGYMYATRQLFTVTMLDIPRATLDRLMAGSNWCTHTQRCQDEPCTPPPNYASCNGLQSGVNLPKVNDGVGPLNEACHSRKHCDGSIICCVTAGMCQPEEGERGIFVHNSKAYYEGGCSPTSLDKDDEAYDPDCRQVGECHYPYIEKTRNSTAKPGAMTPLSAFALNRLMAGSNWNSGVRQCIGEQPAGEVSYSSPLGVSLGFMSLMVTFWG